jgi:hypothetical protein
MNGKKQRLLCITHNQTLLFDTIGRDAGDSRAGFFLSVKKSRLG